MVLQFQLTVNFVALVLSFVAAISNGETPLTVIQLLWVNLIMDALGALGDCCSAYICVEMLSFAAGQPVLAAPMSSALGSDRQSRMYL